MRRELVDAGYRFKTDHSDTEVLVHGYSAWGIDGLVQRIEGDYGFAIWDARQDKLFVVRDRIGVKPLYFAFPQGEFAFASEIKGILEHRAIERALDPIAMYHYLSFLTTPAPLTMFSGIFKLPAGHYAEVDRDGTFSATRYWDAKPGQSNLADELKGLSDQAQENLLVDGIRTRLRDAVGKRMMSDVPFGVFLSGGIDSSTNVALMAELMDRPVDTFSVGFKDHQHLNELDYAQQVAKEFRTNHHEILIDEATYAPTSSELEGQVVFTSRELTLKNREQLAAYRAQRTRAGLQIVPQREVPDPVCRLYVNPRRAVRRQMHGRTYHFCSVACAQRFEVDPDAFQV